MDLTTSRKNHGDREPGGALTPTVPPDTPIKKAHISRNVSWFLDECIRVPGTSFRFGLDPILGLFPYGGETVATIIGTLILGEAGKKGLPVRTLVRMGGNMLLNAALGVVPVAGDLFSFWFKSNSRNHRLLKTYLESEHGDEEAGGWWPVMLILMTVVTVFALNLLSWILITSLIIKGLNSLTGGAG